MELAFHGKTLPSCLGFCDGLVYRQVHCDLQNMQQFNVLSDAKIDEIVVEYLSRHGLTTGRFCTLANFLLAVHGCIDGFLRRILFLKFSSKNLLQTVLEQFMNAVEKYGEIKDGPRPSRIGVDHGVENVLVCDAMVA